MTIIENIIETGKRLASINPNAQELSNARDWYRAGAVSRYSNEDTDVLQGLASAIYNATR